jgi:hypothetical protein
MTLRKNSVYLLRGVPIRPICVYSAESMPNTATSPLKLWVIGVFMYRFIRFITKALYHYFVKSKCFSFYS